ncbi:MAG: M20/M25/M40 family metallo-hydrolase, partial [Nostocoides sp.]
VGKVRIEPGGVNAIASAATAWLDARGANPDAVRGVIADVSATVQGYDGTVQEESWTPRTAFHPDVVRRMGEVLGGIPTLGTGAGHDAGVLAQAGIDAGMLFVRNPTGVSHSPAEFADEADCLAGVEALAAVALDLTGERR